MLPSTTSQPTSRKSELAKAVVEEARTYLGTRWRHMGRTRLGIDCVGLIVEVGKKFNLHQYPDDVNYTRHSNGQAILEPFMQYGSKVPLEGSFDVLQDADVLILRELRFPQHVGIVASKDGIKTLIHASIRRGRVVEDHLEDFLHQTIGAFRYKDLA